MDIHLDGGMDGIETAAVLQERFRIPVIYLTAYADRATLNRAKTTQPYGYIVKPFSERDPQASIEMARYKHERECDQLTFVDVTATCSAPSARQ